MPTRFRFPVMPCGKNREESAGIEEAMALCGRMNFFNPPRSLCCPTAGSPNPMVWKEAHHDNRVAIV